MELRASLSTFFFFLSHCVFGCIPTVSYKLSTIKNERDFLFNQHPELFHPIGSQNGLSDVTTIARENKITFFSFEPVTVCYRYRKFDRTKTAIWIEKKQSLFISLNQALVKMKMASSQSGTISDPI